MDFEKYLEAHIKRHPSVMPQDIVKLCYQAAFGAEHLLSDIEAAKSYFMEEYERTPMRDIDLYEPISDDVAIVNIAAWKHAGFPPEKLFEMFCASNSVKENAEAAFAEYIDTADKAVSDAITPFARREWNEYISEYRKNGIRPVHHSSQYRDAENPSYRIVNRKYINEIK